MNNANAIASVSSANAIASLSSANADVNSSNTYDVTIVDDSYKNLVSVAHVPTVTVKKNNMHQQKINHILKRFNGSNPSSTFATKNNSRLTDCPFKKKKVNNYILNLCQQICEERMMKTMNEDVNQMLYKFETSLQPLEFKKVQMGVRLKHIETDLVEREKQFEKKMKEVENRFNEKIQNIIDLQKILNTAEQNDPTTDYRLYNHVL